MKNLKKVLSLVLALAMALSLMTAAFAADASDYKDYSKVTYKEAVDVMTAAGIFNGGDGNNFNPDATLNREQAAKIITYMLVGQEKADKLTATVAPYADVAANRWSAGAIAYCTNEGILAGDGNGRFNPTAPVLGTQFAKMLLVALGYDAKIENLVGNSWAINTAKLALGDADLDNGMEEISLSDNLTREQAAQMAYNAMKATLVEYEDKGGDIIIGDITINNGATKATPVTSKVKAESTNISAEKTTDGLWTVEFAEKYCKDLKVTANDTDAFERPASTWKYKNTEIGTYADDADASYTTEVKMGTIYSDLGLSKGIAKANITTYVDGQKTTSNYDITKGESNNKIGGNGVLTEVYYDDEAETVVITMVNTYLGKITASYAASSTKDAYVNFEAKTGSGSTYETDADYAVDSYVLYTYSSKSGDVGVQSMQAAEEVTGNLTAYTQGKSVTVGGAVYESNAVQGSKDTITSALSNAMKSDVTVYLDSYGYAVYVDADAASDNYAVVMGWTGSNSVGVNTNRTATLLFADGTTKSVNVTKDTVFAANDALNGDINTGDIVSYRINSDDEYKLTVLADTNKNLSSGAIITKGNSSLNNGTAMDYNKTGTAKKAISANGKTVFVFYNANTDNYSTYTGIANVPTVTLKQASKVTVYCKSGTIAKFVYVETAGNTVSSSSKDVIFVLGDNSGVSHDSDLGDYYTYDAIVNGEITKINSETQVTRYTIYVDATKNSKDVYNFSSATGANENKTSNGDLAYTTGTDKVENGSVTLGGKILSVADDCKVFRVSADGEEIYASSASSIVKDQGTYADKVWYKTTDGEVTTIVIQTVDETVTPDPTPGDTEYSATIDTNLLTASVTGSDAVASAKQNDIKNAVANAVKAAGYTVTAWGGSYNTGDGTGLTVSIVLGTTTSGVPTTLAITYAQQA
ncbi:S-layer homology domain-containing protein [Ruthenibacterium lactatiformans]|uniref:S-layer homology domain-containing protein n=1 Tax=Ruthenibacterium lactatiformans TaxID=1550024 RepID=UPI003521419D